MSVRPSFFFFIRIGTSPVLQHHFTGVRTVSPTAGLDRVVSHEAVLGEREKSRACIISFFLSLYTARPSFEYYRKVYFVHSGLQDESLQVTISKLP